jgi:molecular chaperone GrpE
MADTNRDPSVEADTQASSEGRPADDVGTPTQAASDAIDPTDHARVAAEYKDKVLRVLAEMENLRRRTEREIADTRAYGITAFARDILAVADNMDRALQALDGEIRANADAGVKGLLDGVELTERELHKVLEKHGVKKFEPLGEKFDPNLHQAMFELQDPSRPAGTVAQVMQPGYKIGDRILRPAMVAVAKGGPKVSAEGPANDNLTAPAEDSRTQKDPQHSL